jgi:CheY-like chemotaxis protein
MRELYLQDLLADPAGGNAGQPLAISRFPYIIGRQRDCDGRFESLWVSRRHCRFFLVGDQVWVEDLGSRNGTLLNGEPLRYPHAVLDGDRFELAGMVFQVHLPAASAAPAPASQQHGPTAPPNQPRQPILVVEDNPETAQTLAMLLRQWGHEVAVAHDGPQAISLARESRPRTVLLDIGLPGMDGYEVAKQLRTQAGLGETLLVAMTGCQDETANRSESAGLHALLPKPVAPDALRELIDCLP